MRAFNTVIAVGRHLAVAFNGNPQGVLNPESCAPYGNSSAYDEEVISEYFTDLVFNLPAGFLF